MRVVLFIGFLFTSFFTSAQDVNYAFSTLKILCSDSLAGRGYVNDGAKKTAHFVKSEMLKFGLTNIPGRPYFQEFQHYVNSFPGKVEVFQNSNKLKAGLDFMPDPSSPYVSGKFKVIRFNKEEISNEKSLIKRYRKAGRKKQLLLFTSADYTGNEQFSPSKILNNRTKTKAPIGVEVSTKITSSVSNQQRKLPVLFLQKDSVRLVNKDILKINIEPYFTSNTSSNVIGFLEGISYPDSFIVITAHYDHLGMLGNETYMRGANDNASGVATMLDLAKYYSEHIEKRKYSILFIAFAGEETGLLGSKYYTENPYFQLSKIKFLLNLDLLATGDDGITVVNAIDNLDHFNTLKSINESKYHLKEIGKRPNAPNSDHYYFAKNGVPSFFIYALGKGITAYHDPGDVPENVKFPEYLNIFGLITDFLNQIK